MKKILLILLLPLLTIIIVSTMYSQKSVSILPGKTLTLTPYTDTLGSVIHSFTQDSLGIFSLKGHIDSTPQYPVIGVRLFPENGHFSMQGYKTISIKTIAGCSAFNLTLTAFEDGFSTKTDTDTHRYLQLDTKVKKSGDSISINLKEIPIPAWWYAMNNTTREAFGTVDYAKISSLVISNHPKAKPFEPLNFSIESIELHRDKMLPAKLSLIWLFIAGLSLLIRRAQKKTEIRHIQITPQEANREPKEQMVLSTIANNYSDSEFSITTLSENTAISPYHIRNIIQKEYGCTFSAYLKLVRILEAERLLKESDCDIKEIAYRTGFTHPSAFNRAFKERNGVSPSQFRTEVN